MAIARSSPTTDLRGTDLSTADEERWRLSDGVLFSVCSSLLLWGLLVAGLHATLT